MRKLIASALAIVAALAILGGIYVARASDRSGAPPGVAADHWYRIGDDLGVAIDNVAAPRRLPQEQIPQLLSTDGAEGRLFARVNGSWVPVYLKTHAEGLYPAR
jgi:hypothetical protein